MLGKVLHLAEDDALLCDVCLDVLLCFINDPNSNFLPLLTTGTLLFRRQFVERVL